MSTSKVKSKHVLGTIQTAERRDPSLLYLLVEAGLPGSKSPLRKISNLRSILHFIFTYVAYSDKSLHILLLLPHAHPQAAPVVVKQAERVVRPATDELVVVVAKRTQKSLLLLAALERRDVCVRNVP